MGTWDLLERLLIREAALDDLLKYVRTKHGEHAADELAAEFQKMPTGSLKDLPKTLYQRYVDPKMVDLAKGVVQQLSGWDEEDPTAQDAPAYQEPAPEKPKSVAPWQKPVGNKIKGLPTSLPSVPAPTPAPEPEADPEEPEMPRDFVPGATRGPRPTGFVDPAQNKGTKASSGIPAAAATKVAPGASGAKDLQRRLAAFAKKYGPQPTDTPEQAQQKQSLVDRMAKKYGIPAPTFDDEGRPVILDPERLARKMGDQPQKFADPSLRGLHKPRKPGQFVGQIYRPPGVGQPRRIWYGDPSTGQMNRREIETNPKLTGQEVVWDGNDWVTPSQFATTMAQTRAMPQKQPTTHNPDDLLPQWLRPGGSGSQVKKRTKLD